jgi:hypothetical protein
MCRMLRMGWVLSLATPLGFLYFQARLTLQGAPQFFVLLEVFQALCSCSPLACLVFSLGLAPALARLARLAPARLALARLARLATARLALARLAQ